MKLITRDTDYAIRAVCYLAGRTQVVTSVAELAQRLKIPRSFLRKILQVLNRERVLKSYKGQGGGFMLALRPDNITLADLVEIFQGDFKINECRLRKMNCPNARRCILKKKLDSIEEYVARQLEAVLLQDLLK